MKFYLWRDWYDWWFCGATLSISWFYFATK